VAGLQQAFERVGWPGPQPQVADFSNLDSQAVTAAYLSLPELRGVLVIEQTRRDLVRSQLATLMVNLSVMLASAILALYIALVATRSIALPVIDLVDVATHIASTARQGGEAGPAGAPAESTRASLETAGQDLQERTGGRKDEIGALGSAFYAMTVQLSGLIGGLEAIVAERTRQLETRSAYLEASADISRVTTSILDPERLVEQVVELIRDRFDLYYVGLFLPDPEGRWAVLRSGTGEAGQRMLARSHRLRIEPTSMIGWCISNAQARIAQVAGEDEVRAPNPDLPETRSEAALPLRARGQVIGALSVQSTRPMAFDSASLAVLQTMADQLAIAIENAQLYATSQQALEAQRRAYAVSAHSEWRDWARLRSGLSVRSTPEGPQALPAEAAAWRPEMLQAAVDDRAVADGERLAIPIRVRGAVIGVIGASRPAPSGQPTPGQTNAQDLAFLETIAEQLGVALDSARLYAETRQRSEQDRLVDEITGRMRATLDLRSVLETAAREMRQALNLAEVEVRLSPPAGANGGPDDR
ncbi:MAG: GAF domain-containing protein, partial [Chloroflexota bacterium]